MKMTMTNYELELLPKAKRNVKSLKRQPQLFNLIKENFHLLTQNPFIGHQNKSDLQGVYSIDFQYEKATFEIAYVIDDEMKVIIIILIGSRENFYNELKRDINIRK